MNFEITNSTTELSDGARAFILMMGFLLASIFIFLGVLIERYKRYDLIAGYNRTPDSMKKYYDIEGLAKHVGNGLSTLGVLLIISTLFLVLNLEEWFFGAMSLFLFVVIIIVLGVPKFTARRRYLATKSPGDAAHPLSRRLLPNKIFRALERGTRQWLIECRHCGHKRDFWETGGIRYKAVGEPGSLYYCPKCKKGRWHKIRKKNQQERREI